MLSTEIDLKNMAGGIFVYERKQENAVDEHCFPQVFSLARRHGSFCYGSKIFLERNSKAFCFSKFAFVTNVACARKLDGETLLKAKMLPQQCLVDFMYVSSLAGAWP